MTTYRILLPLLLFFFAAEHATVEASSKTISQKNSAKKKFKVAGKKKFKTSKKVSKKNHSMSMYTKEIHPGDKMLVDNFGKQVGFAAKDFSKIDKNIVCEKKTCIDDVDQSTCYRAFRGDIEHPEKGCQGYQRRTMGKNIGKVKKESRLSSGGRANNGSAISRPGRNSGGKPTIGALDDGPLALNVLEDSTAGVTPVPGGKVPTVPGGNTAAAIAGIGGAAVVGGLIMHNIADDDDDDDTVTPGNNGIHAMFAPAAAGGAGAAADAAAGAIPAAAVCSTQVDAEALGDEIQKIHAAELAGLGVAPVPGSENPQNSHQTLYDFIISQLTYLATITDLQQLNSGIDNLTGHLNILIGNNSIQSHFSANLAHKIISAVSCIRNIGTPNEINESIGWLATKM